MAGHSKWANIQHRKGAQDAKRGKLFTKLIREIVVAAKAGGPDADSNPRLRQAIDKGFAGNMTKDTIAKAVKRGAGGQDGDDYFEIRYEGYGPSGVAIMVDCLSDNKNRTVSDVRHAFTKRGGNLGTDGSVSYLFVHTGLIHFAPGLDEDDVMELALDSGAEDVIVEDDGSIEVQTTGETFLSVKAALIEGGLEPANAELTQIATTGCPLDKNGAEKLLRLQDALEDLDDVQNVFTNAEISDEVLAELNAEA